MKHDIDNEKNLNCCYQTCATPFEGICTNDHAHIVQTTISKPKNNIHNEHCWTLGYFIMRDLSIIHRIWTTKRMYHTVKVVCNYVQHLCEHHILVSFTYNCSQVKTICIGMQYLRTTVHEYKRNVRVDNVLVSLVTNRL